MSTIQQRMQDTADEMTITPPKKAAPKKSAPKKSAKPKK
jgi:hypothetical protein